MITPRQKAAYERAKAVLKSAHQQGEAGEPLSGDALMAAELIDRGIEKGHYTTNSFTRAHQRGIEGLPITD